MSGTQMTRPSHNASAFADTSMAVSPNVLSPEAFLVVDISVLRQRAESGSVVAQALLGNCFLDGLGVEINYPEAFACYPQRHVKGFLGQCPVWHECMPRAWARRRTQLRH